VRALAELFWNAGGAYPTLRAVTLLAVLGAVAAAVVAARKGRLAGEGARTALLAFAGLSLIALVQTSFYLGDVRLAYQARLASSYAGAMGLLAAYPLYLVYRRRRAERVLVVFAALFVLCQGTALASRDPLGRTLALPRAYRKNLEVLRPYARDATLVVAERPGLYAAQMYGATSLDAAEARPREIASRLARRELEDVLVIREELCTSEPAGLRVGPAFDEATLADFRDEGDRCVRIVRIRRKEAPPPGAM
jgi:hypothetical protein